MPLLMLLHVRHWRFLTFKSLSLSLLVLYRDVQVKPDTQNLKINKQIVYFSNYGGIIKPKFFLN